MNKRLQKSLVKKFGFTRPRFVDPSFPETKKSVYSQTYLQIKVMSSATGVKHFTEHEPAVQSWHSYDILQHFVVVNKLYNATMLRAMHV